MGADRYIYKIINYRVVDGDTIVATIDLGFNITYKIRIRLYKVDAPEINTFAGQICKDYVTRLLATVDNLYVETIKDRKDKYGRYLGILLSKEGDKFVNLNFLIKQYIDKKKFKYGKQGVVSKLKDKIKKVLTK